MSFNPHRPAWLVGPAPKHVENYKPIEYTSDGRGDYHDQMMKALSGRDTQMRQKALSNAWTRRIWKSNDPERIVMDLISIRDSVTNLLKVHGVPRGTTISIACIGQIGHGAATFDDIGIWKKPRLLMDTEVYANCDGDDVIDVYCGIGLHEASHLNHTRSMFQRMENGTLSGQRMMWEGLWEDERIENKVRRESPGFAPYLQVCKRALFEKKEFGSALTRWYTKATLHKKDAPRRKDGSRKHRAGDTKTHEMGDMDRINVLVFAFIRCPHRLTADMKGWQTLAGRCIFEELRSMFALIPETEKQVEHYGQLLMDWYKSHVQDYKSLMQKSVPDIAKDLMQQCQQEGGQPSSQPGEAPKQPESPSQSQPKEEQGDGVQDAKEESQEGQEQSQEGEQAKQQEDPQEAPNPPSESPKESDPSQPNGEAKGSETSPEEAQGESGDDGTTAQGQPAESQSGEVSGQAAPGGEMTKDQKEEFQQHVEDRLESQRANDQEDQMQQDDKEKMEQLLRVYKNALDQYSNVKKSGEAKKSETAQKQIKTFEEKLEKVKKAIEKEVDDRAARGRFGLKDLIEMMRRVEKISKPLSKDASEEMAKVTEERVKFGKEWKPDAKSEALKTLIIHPISTPASQAKFKNYCNSVRHEVAAMKSVFKVRLGTHHIRTTELKEGRLNRRMIGRAMQTDRLFYKSHTKTDKGLAIGILLDESGSMSRAPDMPSNSKASRALQVCALISQALKGAPGIELEVFSHTTCGEGMSITQVKYLYGKDNPHMDAIANYGRGQQNYDYAAIGAVCGIMQENTENENKLLIVVSDGAPCGHHYNWNMDAFQATKKSVDMARQAGFKVLQIAIDDYRGSERMYGAKNVIKFTDTKELVKNMRKFITGVVLGTTNT